MLFRFLKFSQCVCLDIKRSTKLQISKSTPKGDMLLFFLIPFQELQQWLVWTTKLFSFICDIKVKSCLLKFDRLAGGENT